MKKILTILLTIIPIFAYSQADIAKREIKVDSLRARVTNLWIHGQTVFDHSIKINTDTAATIKALRDSVNVLKDSINSINGRLLGGGITTLNQTFTIGNAFTLNCGDIKVIASRTNSSFGVYSPDDNIYYQYDDLTTTHTFNGFLNFNSSANFAVLPTYNSHGLFNQTYSIADSFALQTGTLRLVLDDHRSRFSLWDNGSERFYYNEPTGKFKFNCTLDDLNASNIIASGDLVYDLHHAVGSADSVVGYSIGGTQNVYYKINTASYNWRESSNITTAGDSAYLTPGHYKIHCWLGISTSNAGDKLRVRRFINGIASPTSSGRWIINSDGGTSNVETKYFMYYTDIMSNSWISIWITNLTGNRAISVYDFKLFIEKVPEI